MWSPLSAPSRWLYALAGLLAALAGIAVGHLVAAVVNPAASPVLAIGSTVVDATPTPVKEWAVATLGTADKPFLVTVVSVVALAAAAGVGVLSRTRLTPALVLMVLLASLTAVAAATRPSATGADAIPGLLTAVTGAGVLRGLHALLQPSPWQPGTREPGGAARRSPSRRSFLVGAAGVAAGAAAIGSVAQGLAAKASRVAVPLPPPTTALPPLPAGLETSVPGISAFRTPVEEFYRIDTRLIVPRVSVDGWTLKVSGMVERPFELTYAELIAMPLIERDVTLTCVSNEVGGPYIGGARWTGVRVRDLLERAGLKPGVDQIYSHDDSGFTISTPVQAHTDDRDALVAVAMDGRPLPDQHGFPARLVTPGLYGFVGSTKWLTELEATTYAAKSAYWTDREWATNAPILTQSRIDTPFNGKVLKAGTPVAIGGVAWAQGRGVTRVEVRIDRGPWQQATLGPDAGIDYWRQWFLRWTPAAGDHTLSVRATDGAGQTQADGQDAPFPKGATGWHTVQVQSE